MNHTHEQSPLFKNQPPGHRCLLLTPPPERIALFRALNGLGDIVFTVPTFRALRDRIPTGRNRPSKGRRK